MCLATVTKTVAPRHRLFLFLSLLICLAFWAPLRALVLLCLNDDRYTHILLIPVISAGLLYIAREQRFPHSSYSPKTGTALILLGLAIFMGCRTWSLPNGDLSIAIGALVVAWTGLYILCYGIRSFQRASFPFLLILLMIPLPSAVLDRFVTLLQTGSAELSYRLFQLVGVPVFRHGTVMSVPGVDIEVAPQCSGIRSTMALLIVSLVMSRLLLRSAWGKLSVLLCVIPIGIFRNAVRIVGITLLGIYVNKDFLVGNLHHRGGLLFALIGFAVLLPIVWLLRIFERRGEFASIDVRGVAPASGRKVEI